MTKVCCENEKNTRVPLEAGENFPELCCHVGVTFVNVSVHLSGVNHTKERINDCPRNAI